MYMSFFWCVHVWRLKRLATKNGQVATSPGKQGGLDRRSITVEVHRKDVHQDDGVLGDVSPGTAMFLNQKRK